MKKAEESAVKPVKKRKRPALSTEARENQLISLAVDLAEQQLMDGTASAQVITHYLKLGSTRERVEKDILERKKELVEARTQAIRSTQRMEELYEEAIKAMRSYSSDDEYEEDPYI
ncbi:MAG: hypothetical protein NC120_07240 [Ruminococcus sp.]|nr:hypothetical protein [Ruminococcus sp.]